MKSWKVITLLAVLSIGVACNSTIDDGGGANIVLQVSAPPVTPAVTAQVGQGQPPVDFVLPESLQLAQDFARVAKLELLARIDVRDIPGVLRHEPDDHDVHRPHFDFDERRRPRDRLARRAIDDVGRGERKVGFVEQLDQSVDPVIELVVAEAHGVVVDALERANEGATALDAALGRPLRPVPCVQHEQLRVGVRELAPNGLDVGRDARKTAGAALLPVAEPSRRTRQHLAVHVVGVQHDDVQRCGLRRGRDRRVDGIRGSAGEEGEREEQGGLHGE